MFQKIRRWFKRPKQSAGHVYYVRLKTPQGAFYKVGYTSMSTLLERMAYSGHGDERLIERELLFTYREDAWDIEQTFLDHFSKHRAFGKFSNDPAMPLGGRGQSELFSFDVLGLDEELYKMSDEQRKAMQDELGKAGDGCLMVLLGIALIPFTLGLSLFFILGGFSDALTHGKTGIPNTRRPKHPPKIKELLDALTQQNRTAKGKA